MTEYVMTPARRAALRKAQLISARNRRKHTALGYAAHDARQRVAIAYREGQLKHYKAKDTQGVLGQKTKQLSKRSGKRAAKYTARKAAKTALKAGLTLGAATAIGYTAGSITQGPRQRRAAARHLGSMNYGRQTNVKSTRVHPVFGAPVKSLGMGPKGRATVRQRKYRASRKNMTNMKNVRGH